jgi:peptidyl-prolyl cis-trans isomerase C
MPREPEPDGPEATRKDWRRSLPSWVVGAAREPLAHFALIGVLIFAATAVADEMNRPAVRLSESDVAQLAAFWETQSGRQPTREELRGIVAERVDEEIMAQEALRLGLDRDDVIIRRRLAQKYAFVREDLGVVAEPDDARLRAYYSDHRDLFATPAVMSLRQIYFSAERGAGARAAADAAFRTLQRSPEAAVDGDVFILPLAYASISKSDLERDYGASFAAALARAPEGGWTGPLQSPFGWHVVRVEKRHAQQAQDFEAVREAVRLRWIEDAQAKKRDAERKALRARYRVETPRDVSP